MTCSIVFIK